MEKATALFLATFLCLIVSAQGGTRDNITSTEVNTIVHEWENMENKFKNFVDQMIKMVLPIVMEESSKFNLSSTCMGDAMKLIAGLKKTKHWALKFIDSSAKGLDGILAGSLSSYGSYDQCLNTAAINERKRGKKIMFTGKYCLLEMKPPLPPKKRFYKLKETLDELKEFASRTTVLSEMANNAHFFYFLSLRLGICVPSGCSLDDMNEVVAEVLKNFGFKGKFTRCEIKENTQITPLQIGIITAFSFFGFLLLVGTMIDIYCFYRRKHFNSTPVKILQAFSFIANFRKFADTSTSSETLTCLHGIRFLSMSWIVLGHTYFIVNYQILQGMQSMTSFAYDFAFQAIVNASVTVDTFFFIGGLLVCYASVKLVVLNKHPFNLKVYIIHRLWRIVPTYVFVVASIFLVDLTGSGPIFHETTEKYVHDCRENWWINFLFINNFYHADKKCIPQSWYISTDMQLYIASLAVLLLLFRWPKVGLSIAGIGIFSSMAVSGLITYLYDYPPTMLFVHPDPNQLTEYWTHFYHKPYSHAGPYCIGLISGYILAMHPKLKIPKAIQFLGWSLAFSFCMSVLYGVWEWNKGVDPTVLETILYSSCNRVAWTLGVAWMVICCSTGHGGIINYILSWKFWIPLGRLTFIVYLVHPIVQISVVANFRGILHPAHYFAVWIFLGHMCVTYAIAFAGTMLVESPFIALEKLILQKVQKTHSGKDQDAFSAANGDMKVAKNGDIATIVPLDHSVFQSYEGEENKACVYRL